ncbi:MAG: hypothetical protein L0Z62_08820, partial [Gemmataceae bacterium]|nr:hypothetical protein [Gemmataceae bacterium]
PTYPHYLASRTRVPFWACLGALLSLHASVGCYRQIYDEQAFQDLPVLADALEQAGCTSEDILNHCRQQKNHIRGCWLLDLVLGQS